MVRKTFKINDSDDIEDLKMLNLEKKYKIFLKNVLALKRAEKYLHHSRTRRSRDSSRDTTGQKMLLQRPCSWISRDMPFPQIFAWCCLLHPFHQTRGAVHCSTSRCWSLRLLHPVEASDTSLCYTRSRPWYSVKEFSDNKEERFKILSTKTRLEIVRK